MCAGRGDADLMVPFTGPMCNLDATGTGARTGMLSQQQSQMPTVDRRLRLPGLSHTKTHRSLDCESPQRRCSLAMCTARLVT